MKRLLIALLTAGFLAPVTTLGATKKIVFIAGRPSHGPGEHEYRAGCLLFQKCLAELPGIETVVYTNDWPQTANPFAGAAAVVMYCSGADGHPVLRDDHLAELDKVMATGAGFGCIHWAVEVPKDRGGPQFLRWMGGYFETNWSVNPTWDAHFTHLPRHPVTRGVRPFHLYDEWYYHMRFVDGMKGVTPILSALPPKSTLNRPNGPYGGNPAVREAVLVKHEPQTVMWVYDRPDGGRGFAYTGGHYHRDWGRANTRKLVLNAILWIAKVPVPPNGVQSTVTPAELKANLDRK